MSLRAYDPDAYHRTGTGWRIRHSRWILASILGCGLLSFVGFVYCAIRVKEPRWFVLAAFSTAASILGFILISVWTLPNGETSDAAMVYMLDLWGVSVVFAFLVAGDYLAWRAAQPGAVPAPSASGAATTAAAASNAGWYPDPEAPGRNRYWDGRQWTPYTGPRPR